MADFRIVVEKNVFAFVYLSMSAVNSLLNFLVPICLNARKIFYYVSVVGLSLLSVADCRVSTLRFQL
jgi:hypothetical protein